MAQTAHDEGEAKAKAGCFMCRKKASKEKKYAPTTTSATAAADAIASAAPEAAAVPTPPAATEQKPSVKQLQPSATAYYSFKAGASAKFDNLPDMAEDERTSATRASPEAAAAPAAVTPAPVAPAAPAAEADKGVSPEVIQKMLKMNGLWEKDMKLSDSTDELCKVNEFGMAIRFAVKKSGLMEIRSTETQAVVVQKIFGIVDLVEKVPWSGEEVRVDRRDMRKGDLLVKIKANEPEGGFTQYLNFPQPPAGTGYDTFVLKDENTLEQVLHLTRSTGAGYVCKNIFKRKG